MPADLKTAKALGAESGNGHGCDGQNSRGLGKRSFDEMCETNDRAHERARAAASAAVDEAYEVSRQCMQEARTLHNENINTAREHARNLREENSKLTQILRNFADENKKLLQEKESLASESSGFREKLEHLEDGLKEDDAYLRSLRKKIKNDHDEHERILRGKDDEIARLKPHPCDRAAEAFRHPPSRERAARGAGPRARRGDGESACRGRAHRDGPTDGPAGRRERGAAAASAQRRAGASGGASVGAAASVGSMQQPQPGAPRPYVWVKLES